MPTSPDALLKLMEKSCRDSVSWQLDDVRESGASQVMFLNAHGLNSAAVNEAFYAAVSESDCLLRDGIGLALGYKVLGLQETENLNGTDLIPKILNANKGKRIAVWGSSTEALEKLKARLHREDYQTLEPFLHGFSEDEFYLETYRQTQPQILVLCMGMPRQEILAAKLRADGAKGIIICGGGWANFYSGHNKRAPEIIRRLRMEWVHRLLKEPRRLGKRYTVDLFSYFNLIFRIKRATKG